MPKKKDAAKKKNEEPRNTDGNVISKKDLSLYVNCDAKINQ